MSTMAEAYAVRVCPAPLHAVHASILEVIDAQRCDAKAAYLAGAKAALEMAASKARHRRMPGNSDGIHSYNLACDDLDADIRALYPTET